MSLELPYGYTDLNPQGSSNVDAKYGYYNSISEALINVPLAMRKGGRTVGIKQADGSIIEYWWENDNDLSDEGLVKKKAEPFDPTQLEADIQNLENTKQDNLGFTPENIANKGGLLNPSNITYPTTQEVSDALGGKVDKEAGKGLSQENYTTAEKDKLAGLESSKWRGLYISKSALELANPTPEGGDYADVDAGTGSDTIRYVYDETDGEWIESGSGAPLTAEQIKQMYESNTDTNAFTDSLKSWLQGMTAQFTTVLKNSYDNAVTWISTNGQNILDHINSAHAPADAQKNVKSDWEATTGDAEILNKPTKTSGFLNDGEDGINPFVSVSDIYRGSVLLDYDFVNVPNTYEYDVTVRKYIIDDNYFNDPNAATTRVTLEPSHATLNRRDVVVINLAGVISVKTGTPSAAPFAPNIDYNTELVIKEILVTAGTTAPTEVNTLIVYDENLGTPTEFSTSVIGADINLADTTRAQSGTVSVLFKENTTESDVAVFTAPTPFLMSDYDSLNFWVYLVEQHSMTFSIGAYRSSGTLIRQKTLYKDSFTQAGEWILVSIPTTELIPTIITELNEVPVGSIRISKVSGASHVHFDNIFLQGGITNNLSAHNSLSGKQGGNEQLDEYYHLSKEDYLKVLNLNPDFTTDESLYLDPVSNILRANLTTHVQTFDYISGPQVFTLLEKPVRILYIWVQGVGIIKSSQRDIDVNAKTITINDELHSGDIVTVCYSYVITEAIHPFITAAQVEDMLEGIEADLADTIENHTHDYNDLNNLPDLSAFDNVDTFPTVGDFPAIGKEDVFYIDNSTGKLHRWNGTGYSVVAGDLALGETASTAYRGDRGKIAYDHTSETNNPHNVTKAQIGLGNVDNTSDMDKPVSIAQGEAIDALEFTTDKSIYLDPLTKELRANVSDFSEKYTYTSGNQEFVLTSTPGKIIYISVNGQLLEDPLTQWSIDVPTKTITILDELDMGDRVTIHYQYFITT